MVTGAIGCEQLAQSRYAAALGQGSNSRPLDRESDILPLRYHATPRQAMFKISFRCRSSHNNKLDQLTLTILSSDSTRVSCAAAWSSASCTYNTPVIHQYIMPNNYYTRLTPIDGVLGWQWHQLNHMQTICTLLQTDNHTITIPYHSIIYRRMLFLMPNRVKALKATTS